MRIWCLVLASLSAACGRVDGVVGVEPLEAGGATSTSAAGAPGLGFLEEFSQNSGIWQPDAQLPSASTAFGVPSADARDGNVATLTFPGHPEYTAADEVGPGYVTELATTERFGFGTYRSRLGFGACDPREETVMSFLGYFHDGRDRDGDGIVDDLEIDVQVTCGAPSRAYLTVYTDDAPDGSEFRKLSHVIDFATGEAWETPRDDSELFASLGTDQTLIAPGSFSAGTLYELGFEWHTASIRFFLRLNGAERDLWTLNGAEHVPQAPVHIVYNAWHPATHWFPATGAADFPARDVTMSVDWVSFEPE